MTQTLLFDDIGLLCPACGGNLMHHGQIEIFERDEDEENGMHVTVNEAGEVKVDGLMDGNPSDRRHGLTIAFWCESCEASSTMSIAQHKGYTFMGWDSPEHP